MLYSNFINLVTVKLLNIYYEEYAEKYVLKTYNISVEFSCLIYKDGSNYGGLDPTVEANNRTDFEVNHKNSAINIT